MAGLPGLPPPGFASAGTAPQGLPGLPPPGFASQQEPTFLGDLPAIGQRAMQGAADVGSFIEGINPFQMGGPRYARKLADLFTGNNSTPPSIGDQMMGEAEQYGLTTDAQPQTPMGQIASEVAYYLPGAVIPGGALGGRIASAGGAGLAAGTTKALGGSEVAQALAGLGGSFLPVGAAGISKGLGAAGDDFERMALNIQRSDLKRADRYAKVAPGEDPKLIQALDGARSRGLMKGNRSPEALVARNEGMIDDLGSKVSAALKEADAAQTDIIFPRTTHAETFISKSPYEAEKLQKQLASRMDALNKSWDGSVSGLSDLKQQLYKIGYNGSTESKALDRALARDLKEAIEAQTAQFAGLSTAEKVKKLNAQMGENLTLRDVLQKGVYNDQMAGGAAKALRRGIVSPFSGGAALFGGGAALGSPLAMVGGAAGMLATTRGGQFALSDAARTGAKLAGIGAGSGGVVPGVAATKLGQSLRNDKRTKESELPTSPQAQGIKQIAGILRDTQSVPTSQQESSSKSAYNTVTKALSNLGIQDAEASLNKQDTPMSPKYIAREMPTILKAVAKVESNNNSRAISHAGAKGKYQLMDALGKEYHRRLKLTDKYDPHNDAQAEKIATAFLSDLLKKYDDPKFAYAAYNAGEPRVDQAIKTVRAQGLPVTWPNVLKHLPNETRAYVPKIESHLA